MESNIQIFKNEEFGQVRTITIDGDPWFIGKDISDILGYQNGSRDINRHVDEEDKYKTMIFDGNQDKETIIINESGLYSLILSSRMPKAKKFKRWVTSEVLPSIRKHGIYATDNVIDNILNNPDFGIQLLTELKEERAEKERLALENEELKPKAEYCNTVLKKPDLITTTVIAKDLGITARMLNKVMNANGIIYKGPFGSWCPYAKYQWLITEGYADYQSYEKENTKLCLKWTEKGRKWIMDNYNNWVANMLAA